MTNNNDRIVYVQRSNQWVRIPFGDLSVNESFILCESDGTPIGHYVAASKIFKMDEHDAVMVLEMK